MIKEIEYSNTILKLREAAFSDIANTNNIKLDEDKISRHFGYFLKEKLIGVCTFTKLKHFRQIRIVAIHPDHQRKGYGQELVSHVSKLNNKVCVNANDIKTLFYEKCGFKKVGGSKENENGNWLIKTNRVI